MSKLLNMGRARLGVAFVGASIVLAAVAHAAPTDRTWVGLSSTANWGNAANWTPAGGFLTSQLDTAIFNGAGVTTVNSFLGGGSRAGTDLRFNDNADGAVRIDFSDAIGGSVARSLRLVGNIDVSSDAAGTMLLNGVGVMYWGVFVDASGPFSHSITNNSTVGGVLNIDVAQTFGETVNSTSTTLTYGGTGAINLNGGIVNVFPELRTVNVVKAGTDTVSTAGTNSYNGTTTINNGTWLANGTHSGAGNYSVVAGTLGGTGAINLATADNVVTVNGKLAPGSVTAIQSLDIGVGDLTLAGTADFQIDLTAATFDEVNVGDLLTYGGVLNVAFTGADTDGATFDIFDFAGAAGAFSAVNFTGVAPGQSASFDPLTGIVALTAVPEPASAMLIAVVGSALLPRRRAH